MKDKRSTFKDFVLTTLQVHDTRFKADERLRDAVLHGASRAVRNQVMGDPVRYVVVFHTGRRYPSGVETDVRGRPLSKADVFTVQVWYTYKDHETQAYSSTEEWDDAIFHATTGLVEVLEATDWIDDQYHVGIPEGVETGIVPLDNTGKDLAHHLAFDIPVTNYE